MDKQEFITRVNAIHKERGEFPRVEIPTSDWNIIQTVYNWHPSIRPVQGKDDIAAIYCLYDGMTIIRDMLPRAKAHEERDREHRELLILREVAKERLREIEQKIEDLTSML